MGGQAPAEAPGPSPQACKLHACTRLIQRFACCAPRSEFDAQFRSAAASGADFATDGFPLKGCILGESGPQSLAESLSHWRQCWGRAGCFGKTRHTRLTRHVRHPRRLHGGQGDQRRRTLAHALPVWRGWRPVVRCRQPPAAARRAVCEAATKPLAAACLHHRCCPFPAAIASPAAPPAPVHPQHICIMLASRRTGDCFLGYNATHPSIPQRECGQGAAATRGAWP